MERFISALAFILMLVFLSDHFDQNEYKGFKAPPGSESEQKIESKTYYPPTKKKPYTRTLWKA